MRNKESCKKYYLKNRDKILEKNRKWYQDNKKKYNEYKKKWNKEKYKSSNLYRDKMRCRGRLNACVKNGKIEKLPCEICGIKKTEAHHEDYNKPMDVVWLCKKHHEEIHKKYN